jgi:hypothetical protein
LLKLAEGAVPSTSTNCYTSQTIVVIESEPPFTIPAIPDSGDRTSAREEIFIVIVEMPMQS